jgi:adenylate kinase family enzyme
MTQNLQLPKPGPRIVIVGVTGSGKTTLAQQLSRRLGIPHIELDAMHWQANWVMAEKEAFREQVRLRTASGAWVADGNYSKAADILWARATTLVWLDYPWLVSFCQLTTRSLRRLLRREMLWNDNTESWRTMFLSRDSLFVWFFQSFPKLRRSIPEQLARPENAHLEVIRLRSRTETQRWIESLTAP